MKREYTKTNRLEKSRQTRLDQQAIRQFKGFKISALLSSLLLVNISAFASDAEIYVVPENSPGKSTLMFLLDISLSMKERAACDYLPGVVTNISEKSDSIQYQHNGFTTGYSREYCVGRTPRFFYKRIGDNTEGSPYQYFKCGEDGKGSYRTADCVQVAMLNRDPTGYIGTGVNPRYFYDTRDRVEMKYYKRIARVKDALIDMLNGNQAKGIEPFDNKLVLGLSTLGVQLPNGKSYVNTGAIVVPARRLDTKIQGNKTQRDVLIESVARLDALTYTPTARSYAESAAYLLGTHTLWHALENNYNWTRLGDAIKRSNSSGFQYSSVDSKRATEIDYGYIRPQSIEEQLGTSIESQHAKECSGQGIYVLTDGMPNEAAYGGRMMRSALTSKNFTTDFLSTGGGWVDIHKFAEYLSTPAKNPLGIEIKTAVIGFGKEFEKETSGGDIRRTKEWGAIGKGGFYSGNDPEDIVESVRNFLRGITKDVPSANTGSSTIPMDALNPESIQPYAYFPQFEPKPDSNNTQQVWYGNLKKYYVVNNGIYASPTASSSTIVVKNNRIQDVLDIWAKSGVVYAAKTPIYRKGGALSQLNLGTGRKLLTDYAYDGTNQNNLVTRDFSLKQIQPNYTIDAKTKNDPYAKPLMALLGYNLDNETAAEGLNLSTMTPTLRQMGNSPHSLPLLLTQQGKLEATNTSGKVTMNSANRQDYILFGTSQGLVQVVDAKTGVETFSFVPKEVIENQSETFRENGGTLTGGRYALYEGMDGEWTAHTVYVTKSDGTLTVNGTTSTTNEKGEGEGKQWVYGGMRMGGRSYYALDLTKINSPKLKFQIDPTSGKVYSEKNKEGKSFPEIKNMGQSWSKPKLAYINWKGQRKLVMFVAGGYDAGGPNGDGLWSNGRRTGFAGYEYYNYQQAKSNCNSGDVRCSAGKIGAGVYMFDADSGDLLWYADGRKPSEMTDRTSGVVHLYDDALSYSTVSEIKTVDRNNDGIVDHLYFGDLAGQGFRIDLKNDGSRSNYLAQVTKVLDLRKTDGTNPRFYIAPVFTVHHSAGQTEGGNIVVASFISGNKSSPLLATPQSLEKTGLPHSYNLEYDAVYAIYDYDIYPNGAAYPTATLQPRTLSRSLTDQASPTKLKLIENTVRSSSYVSGAAINSAGGWGGWYYPFKRKFSKTNASAAVIKGLTPLVAMENSLYVTMYDASDLGTVSGCGAGVQGQSFTKRLCLPTGVCAQNADYTYNLGSGIISLGVGPSSEGGRGIVVPDPENVGVGGGTNVCEGSDCKGDKTFISAGGKLKFIPNRWYERYAKTN